MDADDPIPAGRGAPTRAPSPLRHLWFRRLWLANMVSSLGFWMQQVAAAWLMTRLTSSAALVALLATAAALPTFLLALPAGALTDILDRRRLIIATQVWQFLVAGLIGVGTLLGAMTPALLLAGIAAYGLGNTLGYPAQSAIIPELVSADELVEASALNATGFTAAQAVGPALGGALVVAIGPGWAFIANALSFLATLGVFVAWRRAPSEPGLPAEHVLSAMRSGLRYVRYAPAFQLVLLRLVLYMFCSSAMPALLVVVVQTRLGASAGGYGLALGVFGVGGVLAALALPRIRGRVSVDALTVSATLVVALAVFLPLGTATSVAATLPGLLVGGAASMLVLSTLQAAALEVLPDWVRGRGLAIVQLGFQAAIAVGGITWGSLAAGAGPGTALLVAGAALVATSGGAVALGARLRAIEGLDVRPAPLWAGAAGELAAGLVPDDGPVTVLIEYEVAPEDTDAFRAAMRSVGRARRRDGAIRWSLATDAERADRHLESYSVGSWVEHERELQRLTRADASDLETARALHRGDGPPAVRELLGHRAAGVLRGHGVHPSASARGRGGAGRTPDGQDLERPAAPRAVPAGDEPPALEQAPGAPTGP